MTKATALVLERQHELALREIDLPMEVGPRQVKIKVHTVGVCGSDVHYYTHGRIGPFVVDAPMVLGHEAAGTIVEIGRDVTHLKVGDRVCMEPGIPDPNSKASRLGMYNVDPAVAFWATPPIHGVLTPFVVHPADYTFKLPDNVSFAEGAMVEPFTVGMQAATKAGIMPGDTAVVLGAGPIGIMVAIAALALSGCSGGGGGGDTGSSGSSSDGSAAPASSTAGDPTAHAEMEAIRDAARRLRTRDLSGCTLVSTSRPCRMCEAAAYWAGISSMVTGAALTDVGPPR